jgi:hypothetical protein
MITYKYLVRSEDFSKIDRLQRSHWIRARKQVFVLVLSVLFQVKSKSTSIHRFTWYLYFYLVRST